MQQLEEILKKIAEIVWGNYLIVTLIGVGIFYTLLTKGIQIKGFAYAIRELRSSLKDDKNCGEGTITPFQALCTALSSCVGNGNIVGVATAIASGGAGAIFWMWVAGFVGMATKYAEIVLGIKYREKKADENYEGGPMYYISKGLKMKKMALLFSILMFLQISGGALIQSNAVATVVRDIFDIKPIFSGIMMSIVILLVVSGGIKRFGKVAEKLLPIMTFIYIIGGVVVILYNYKYIGQSFINIFKGAFSTEALGGGVLGHTMREAIRFGVARGLYSNEAGEGSAPVLHATAITNSPAKQGLYGLIEVFVDTFIICSLTAFIVLTSNVDGTGILPTVYVVTAFGKLHSLFRYVIGLSMILFAFSTILSQWYFGNVALKYMFKNSIAEIFKYIFMVLAIIGAITHLDIVWTLQDIVLGIMIIPNLIALIFLNRDVKEATENYFKNREMEK